MKRLANTLRFLVGILFIFSGLVKANDPLGLAFKMEEYFELWKLFWLIPSAKTFSVAMNSLEIIAGSALCLGWQNKWNLRLLLALILFFTALTGYTYYTGYPKTCGCFGDCLPIDSKTSYFKDIFLLAGIIVLWVGQRHLHPIRARSIQLITITLAIIFSVGLQFYVLHHLPIVDCLPYRIGTNITEARKQPPSTKGSTVMLVYEKAGKEISFPADRFPADFSAATYHFVRQEETGEVPQAPIQGFVLNDSSGADVTDEILNLDNVLLIFSEKSESLGQWKESLTDIQRLATKKQFPIALISNETKEWCLQHSRDYSGIRLLSSDRTPIRTAARVNPTVYLLKNGTILGKWAIADWSVAKNALNKQP
ncbi:MAG: BT_3928 family protein [Bacteroidota bacterium]